MDRTLRYDHYKVLGVARDADSRTIKRAYRERVMHCHPDRNRSENASELFRALHDAYSTLMDEEQRASYDERLRHYRSAPPAAAAPPYNTRARYAEEVDRPATPMDRVAFKGLHLTGLLFGCFMVLGIGFGCLFLQWPLYVLFFTLPGLAVIPDSIAGLRARSKA